MDFTVLQIQDGRGLGAELKIQDGGAHASKCWLCWKTAHQPHRGPGIGLTDFHSDTIKNSIHFLEYFFTDFHGDTIVNPLVPRGLPLTGKIVWR